MVGTLSVLPAGASAPGSTGWTARLAYSTVVHARPVAGARSYSLLEGVGCDPTGSTCVAVGAQGWYPPLAARPTSVLSEQGGAWHSTTVPFPGDAGQAGLLQAVDCPATGSCLAVGARFAYGGDDTDPVPLVLAQGATGWAAALPPALPATTLTGLSCSGPARCVVVGFARTATPGVDTPVIERLSGTTWSTEPEPTLPSGLVGLAAVACPSATECFAVGNATSTDGVGRPLVEAFDGTAWSVVSLPAAVAGATEGLDGVACPSTTSCFAVGRATQGSTTVAVDHFDGTAWSVERSPRPAGLDQGNLSAVACATTTSCVAVGGGNTTPARTLVEVFDGQGWSPVPSPTPQVGRGGTWLNGVACPTAGWCWAVGGSFVLAVRQAGAAAPS